MANQDYEGAERSHEYDPEGLYADVLAAFFDDGFDDHCCDEVRRAFREWADEVGLSDKHRRMAAKYGIRFPGGAAVYITRDEAGHAKEVA